jgi:hypothetical protein
MEVQSAFSSGLEGFQKATESASQAASDIAHSSHFHSEETQTGENLASDTKNPSENVPNLNQSIVDLKVAEYQAKASANVIKTADETLGTLLDVSV